MDCLSFSFGVKHMLALKVGKEPKLQKNKNFCSLCMERSYKLPFPFDNFLLSDVNHVMGSVLLHSQEDILYFI